MSTNERDIPTGAATETIPVESGAEIRGEDGEAIRECVLLATNGSPEADAALRFASAIAAREELLLRILTVLEPLPILPAQPSGITYAMTIERERGERVLDRVRAQLSTVATPPRSLSTMLVGRPGATIAEAAREWNAQYIFLGAGRHGTLGRLLAGDTVVRVLRHSLVPVIAVPSTCGDLPGIGIAGVDFGTASLTAARRAASLLGTGVLHLVHVRPEIDVPATDPDAWSEVYEQGASALLNKLVAELERDFPDIQIEKSMLRGHTSSVLLEHAEKIGAELIAVGQHGHGAVDRFIFGSVAQEMVRSAQVPVLVTPPVRPA